MSKQKLNVELKNYDIFKITDDLYCIFLLDCNKYEIISTLYTSRYKNYFTCETNKFFLKTPKNPNSIY